MLGRSGPTREVEIDDTRSAQRFVQDSCTQSLVQDKGLCRTLLHIAGAVLDGALYATHRRSCKLEGVQQDININ